MNDSLKVGQVLWLKVRYQIDKISTAKHPMLIANINKDFIEVIAIDKTFNKMHNLFYSYNYYINVSSPKESVLYEDSYAQLNTKLTIDNFLELKKFRKTVDTLSEKKLNQLLKEYKDYQKNNLIKEERIVHMSKEELLKIN